MPEAKSNAGSHKLLSAHAVLSPAPAFSRAVDLLKAAAGLVGLAPRLTMKLGVGKFQVSFGLSSRGRTIREAVLEKSFPGRRDKKFDAIKGPNKSQSGWNTVGEKK